jgi:hypothetical protein
MTYWRIENHSPTNYRWIVNGTTVVDDTGGRYPGGARYDTIAPTNCTTLRFESTLDDGADYFLMELFHFAAYPAPGAAVPIDGTYNIFYEEPSAVRTGFNENGRWTDHLPWVGQKPDVNSNSVMYEFSQAYNIVGTHIAHYDTTRNLTTPKIDISMDGATWLTVWDYTGDNYKFREAPYDLGYITWDAGIPAENERELNAKYVRLSWGDHDFDDGGDIVEVNEWQVFAGPYIPPPQGTIVTVR